MLTVVKVGGSLCKDKKILGKLCQELSTLEDILIVPGGGEFADLVRKIDNKFSLFPELSHRMAILAMEQTGHLLLNFSDRFRALHSLDKIGNIEGIPILMPTHLLLSRNDLSASWNITSDSIALYISSLVNSEKLILLKDVDGIYDRDPKKEKDARLIPELCAKELKMIKQSCVDKGFPELLTKYGIEVFIINGKYPERVKNAIGGKEFRGTIIKSESYIIQVSKNGKEKKR
ncbi:MAG TPA: delta 1-pyrroline-5-carboxylate synthetase [Candidatus Altiarchaeales archaeon]|nr:delta 1-pyrroline-5-carboxylate synthetase [Candidatus Altiarchaeales archaeon]